MAASLITTIRIFRMFQIPAIAWMYRDDYDRAGYQVLPHGKERNYFVTLQTVLPLLALVPVSLLPALAQTSSLYRVGALLLSLGFLWYGVRFVFFRTGPNAHRLLFASIIYLPSLFVLRIFSTAQL
jgi:protoheme IX farnesyltransferase